MKKLILLAALMPALASAAPPGSPAAGDRGADEQRIEKRMRLARALGLAEALDLDDAAALRVRDLLVRYDAQRAPMREQVRAAVLVLRDAARGDQAAVARVDQALQRARDGRARLQQLDAQMLDEIAKDLTPDKKAKAALFLATFHQRVQRFAMMRHHAGGPGPHGPGMRGVGPGGRRAMDEGAPPSGPGRAGIRPDRQAMSTSEVGDDAEPDLDSAFGVE
jgi:hypothetical protein